eukprot:TRINITY_DN33049_c0_g1_i1.p1 TRINITY_DN33049_c0_g1~~TRINITY_DN33049_c0_g1_i1.p1  ORF type:complete len:562 (-),score=91.83 TRINITY_DN33049_c0_g1_i1:221-1906(-)
MDKVAKFLGWEFGPREEDLERSRYSGYSARGGSARADSFLFRQKRRKPWRVRFPRWRKPDIFGTRVSYKLQLPDRADSRQEEWDSDEEGGEGEGEGEEEEYDMNNGKDKPVPLDFEDSDYSDSEEEEEEESPDLRANLAVYEAENRNLIDYRYDQAVEEELKENPFVDIKLDATSEEIEENRNLWESICNNKFLKFLAKSEEVSDEFIEKELEKNSRPFRQDDYDLWRSLPPVPGPFNGRPIPRKSNYRYAQGLDKFSDFFKERTFGLWNLHQRTYPPEKPLDVAQILGYNFLDKRYYDFIMRTDGVWYYKDRLGRTRGPMALPQLKTAWGSGIIDRHTFVVGEEMDEWAPISMVYGLEKAICTFDARLAAAVTAITHKLAKGIPPWIPLKGREKKTYKQLRDEGIESKEREKAVMRRNGGVWPGESIPSHALFLWASGTELTSILEKSHTPNVYVSNELRKQMARLIPGLRPWEILTLEDAMLVMSLRHNWWRAKTGVHFTTPRYYEFAYNEKVSDVKVGISCFSDIIDEVDYLDPEDNDKAIRNLRKYRKTTSQRQPWL